MTTSSLAGRRGDWLVRHPRDAVAAQLVAYTVPPVGAGAGVHRELARSVPSDIDVRTLRLPGREKRLEEPPVSSIAEAVADLAGPVGADVAEHGLPYVLVGDCAHSLLGFELARALEAAGQPAAAVVAIAARSPRHGYRDSQRHRAPVAQLRQEAAAGGLMPPEITSDPEAFGHFAPVLRADLAACETYQWDGGPLAAVPVVLLLPAGHLADPGFTSWQEATRAGLRLVPTTGVGKPAGPVTTALAPLPELAEQLAELRDRLAPAAGAPPATAAPPAPAGAGAGAESAGVRDQVAALWAGFLPESSGADTEHFLDAGGDSITAVRLRNALRERFGQAPPLATLLAGVTLGELVALFAGPPGDPPAVGADGC